jgi:hypothetical protein
MNMSVFPRTLVLSLICASAPLFAQNLTEASRLNVSTSPAVPPAALQGFATGSSIQPLVGLTPENFSSEQPWYLIQEQASLGYSEAPTVTRPWSLESQLRRNAGPLLKLAVNRAENPPTATGEIAARSPTDELGFALSMLAAIYRADDTPAAAGVANDLEFTLSIRHKIRETPDKLLEIVALEITANPNKVCEIVKAAIKATDGSSKVVASIVETASMTKPESMRLAAQCAVASVPDSLSAVQAVLAQLDPAGSNLGKDSKDANNAKDSKDSKSPKEQVASDLPNPLDIPKLLPPPPPKPPPIYPPTSTKTNFVKPCDYGDPKCPKPPESPKDCNNPKGTF